MIDIALKNFEKIKREALEDLVTLARIPSISFDGFPPEKVQESASAVASLLRTRGLENVEVLNVPGAHPYVYADWLHAPGKPTVLLYAHHDVQPIGRDYLWKSPPFEPTIRDGRLFGRGTADDKAGIVVHTAAVAAYLQTSGKLPINVKFLIEGEEEIGSPKLAEFLTAYQKKLSADAIVLTDTQNHDTGLPSITVSLRGLVATEIEVRSMERSVHSGMLGGAVPDPMVALCKMLASVTDSEGRIAIRGILDQVKALSPAEEKSFSEIPFSMPEFRHQAGLLSNTRVPFGLDGKVAPMQQMWRQPSFSINAVRAGNPDAPANVINECAWAKIGIRLAPGMDPEKTQSQLIEHLRSVAPLGVEVSFKPDFTAAPWVTEPRGKIFEAAANALEKGFGKKPVFIGTGGTIPFVEPFALALNGAPALLIGVEDPYSNAHSENESMHLGDFEKSIRSAIYFYDLIA